MLARAVEFARQRLVERVDDQRRLAAARHAGDAGEGAERNVGVDVLQVVAARADDLQLLPGMAGAAVSPAPGCCRRPVRYCAGDAVGIGMHHSRRAGGDHVAAMDAGARPHIDQIVGGADRILVMLDDDHRVAEIAQPLAGSPAAGRCRAGAGRSTARRAHRARRSGRSRSARRGGCAGSRRPTACRKRAQGQIFEPDVIEESQPLIDFLEDALGDLALLRRQRAVQLGEPVDRLGDREIGDLADIEPAILTASASGFRRWPWQASHGWWSDSGRAPRAPRRCRFPR